MNSVIGWIGGKKQLREVIISHFPSNFEKYVEVFGGAGWVLFARDKHGKYEVYNDMNKDLVNLFRCIKYHVEALQKELNYMLSARENFNDYTVLMKNNTSTDIQRAAMFYYLIRHSFGSKGTSYATRGKGDYDSFKELSARLNRVVVENKDFQDLIKIYDKSNTLFYLDPPYYGTEFYYKNVEYSKDDHMRLFETLSTIKGKFLLSYNDCPEIRKMYRNYQVISVERRSTLSSSTDNKDKYAELLIKNY